MAHTVYAEKYNLDTLQAEYLISSLEQMSNEDWTKLIRDKEDFLNHSSDLPDHLYGLYPAIAESWIKSRTSGVSIKAETLERPFLSFHELSQIQEENRLLIDYTRPLFINYKNAVRSSNYTFHLFDKNGILILNEGTIPSSYPALAPAKGTIWKDQHVGTNACSLSIEIKSPIVLPGFLHYSEIFDNLIASACPVLSLNGEIAGFLGCVQPSTARPGEEIYQKKIAQALGLIVTMASAVESSLKLHNNNTVLRKVHSKLEISSELNEGGIITINNTGEITSINKAASRMLKQTFPQALGKNIAEFLDQQSSLMDLMKSAKKADLEEKICIGKNEQAFLINYRPVLDETDEKISEAVLKLSPKTERVSAANKSGFATRFGFEDLIGESKKLKRAIELGERFADSSENILLIGESGTGKELFAQAIHSKHCPNGPFIAVNCAAMPKSLIESELFGYEGGSFTGAERAGRPGKIELANGGTLFLDEIGDMPFELQAVLLRVLEDKQVMRVGGSCYREINFRMVAATNKNLYQMVKDGQFREDLYFRLSVLTINLPSLRERDNDVDILTNYFIEKYCLKTEKPLKQLSEDALKRIKAYDWPGNVRQLENAIICAMNTETGDVIEPESLPAYITYGSSSQMNEMESICKKMGNGYSLRNWEKTVIEAALAASNNFVPLAADMLEIGKSTLYRKLKEYNINQ